VQLEQKPPGIRTFGQLVIDEDRRTNEAPR